MRLGTAIAIVLACAAFAALAGAEVVQRAGVRVSVGGSLTPRSLPRNGAASVRVAVDAKIRSAKGAATPPQLRQMTMKVNRYGHFNPKSFPVCTVPDIQPSTTAKALSACRSSLVGQGTFSAKVALDRQVPFPANGTLYAFNGVVNGHAAILAHVYGTDPVPTSFTLPFLIEPSHGTFGTTLRAELPKATGNSSYVTGLSLELGKSSHSHGKATGYLTASCPAPKGFPSVSFPLAKVSFGFTGGRTISQTLERSCKVR